MNIPVPDVAHITLSATVTIPFSCIPGKFAPAQTVVSVPAFIVGAGVIVIIALSVTALQSPFSWLVIVSVTDPELISAGEG